MSRTFYWFDYETFGADARRDRPAQFAGLRTDENLNPIGSGEIFYCQPADDYLPDPEACVITGITPFTCLDEGLPEANFAQKIYQRFSEPETIGVGYNNLRFDDELTRFMFWRNLIPPYAREFGSGRGRFDLFNLIYAVYAFKPDTLKWPRREDGLHSLKLEHLSKENQIDHSHAHDALSDVKATLGLARLIKERQPKLWNYALSLIDKQTTTRILNSAIPLLMINPFVGQAKHYLSLIYPMMPNPNKPNEWFCWDLSHDPKQLQFLTSQDVKERLYVSKEKRDQGVEPIPIITLRLNQQPFVVKASPYMTPDNEQLLDVTKAEMNQRVAWFHNTDLTFLHGLWAEVADNLKERSVAEQADIESSLYSIGFPSFKDKQLFESLRQLSAEELADRIRTVEFDNSAFDDLLLRYRARNFPETIEDPEEAEKWQRYRAERLITGRDRSLTFDEFFRKIEVLRIERPDQMELLEELSDYGENFQSEFML